MPFIVQRKRSGTGIKLLRRVKILPKKVVMETPEKILIKMVEQLTILIVVLMGAIGNLRIVGKHVFLPISAPGVRRIGMLKRSINPSTVLINLSSNQRN